MREPRAPASAPTATRRQLHVGVPDGRVLTLDLADGAVLGTLRAPAAVTTQVHVQGDRMLFGCADGQLRLVDRSRGAVEWAVAVGRVPGPADLVMTRDRACVATDAGVLILDLADGGEVAVTLASEELLGLFSQADRVFARARRSTSAGGPPRDVLVALDAAGADILWEYVLTGEGPGAPCADELHVALPSPDAGVLLFR